jgi:hypothetical protein
MPRGLRQTALSISFLSPIVRRPDAFLATKIASLIFLPERRFLDFTSFQSRTRHLGDIVAHRSSPPGDTNRQTGASLLCLRLWVASASRSTISSAAVAGKRLAELRLELP